MKKDIKDITWLKLDNAGLIYPSTLSRKYACMFRLTVTLKDDVDNDILKTALINVLNRFPSFKFELKQGFFWCYLNKIDKDPIIDKDYNNPMLRINFDKNNRYMFRVRTYKKRIALEIFHALADGSASMSFLLTLTCEYLRLKYRIKPEYNELILDPKEEPKKDQIEDAFLKVTSSKGALVHESKAYHIKGTPEDEEIINIITGIMNISDVKREAKKYDATITEYVCALVVKCISEIRKNDKHQKNKSIKVSIPLNLRKIYNINTHRNFSSYVNISIDNKKEYKIEEIIKSIQKQFKYLLDKDTINAKISANVKLMKNPFIRRVPMFIKKHIMSLVEARMGDGYITTNLSNLGLVSVPKCMEKYITDMNFILGKSRGKSHSITCVGYKDKLYITFTSGIKERDLERLFFTKLTDLGIDVYIESNR